MTQTEGQGKQALGKGFNSLLGMDSERNLANRPSARNEKITAVVKLKVGDIEPNPHQPRKVFADEALESLSRSIKVDGVIQPIIVSKGPKPGHYILIAGERRWRASKMAGLDTVPAIIKDGRPDEKLRIALIENIQRADLSVVEEAEAYKSLIDDFGLTQDQCAQKVGKDRTTITNALRLLALPKEVQDDLLENRLTMGHGRALVALEDKKVILRARDIVISKKLNVRQTEQLCRNFKKKGANAQPDSDKQDSVDAADLEYLADAIRSQLRTKVKLSGNGSRGKIEISYFSAAELERIVGIIGVDMGS